MDKLRKQEVVKEYEECFAKGSVVVVHYSGLSVSELNELRKKLGNQASFRVTKNSLAKIALEKSPISGLSGLFTGPTAIAYSDDPVAAAKAVVEFAKNNEKLVVIGGAANDNVVSVEQIEVLAKLPSLDNLRAKLLAIITTPATRIAQILQAPGGQVARVVNAYSQKDN